MGDRGTPAARHLRDLARRLRCRPAPRLANPPGPHYPPLTGTPAVAEPVGRSASWRGFGYSLSPLPVVRPTPAALMTARRWFKRSAGNTPPRNTCCRTIPCTLNACMRGAIEYQASRRRLVLRVIRASYQSCGSQRGRLMTDARIESIKKALGMTDETREQNARENLDGALIEIEQNEGLADADCLRAISRVVGQLATVEWILREEDEW